MIRLNDFAGKMSPDRIFSFYVLSPPEEVLRERLRARGDKEDEIQKRIADCIKWNSEAKISGISYEFVTNNGTIESVTEEATTRFLKKFDSCDSLF